MKKTLTYINVCFLLLVMACNEDSNDDVPLVSKLKSFAFTQELNPQLSEDVRMSINDTLIFATIQAEDKNLVATFQTDADSVLLNGRLQVSGVTANDFSEPLEYQLYRNGNISNRYLVSVIERKKIPQLTIVTQNGVKITSKEDYVKATLSIDGMGLYDDYSGSMQIKGRGNFTWSLPKKPYRLKLDKKASLLGMDKDKDWVLLANYLDYTLMLNAVAMKVGQLMDFPYVNHCIPVDVTLNGVYVGNYMLTEKIEISDTRVNISKTDGYILELDAYYDEEWKFRSSNYDLPVMVKEVEVMDSIRFKKIQADFKQLEDRVAADDFPNNDYADYIDMQSLADYYVISNFVQNQEINHPKSVYMYKDGDAKLAMGPLWDFDWAFGFSDVANYTYFNWHSSFLSNFGNGYAFFHRFVEDEVFMELYKNRWNYLKEKLPQLYDYIDEYEALIAYSQEKDFAIWGKGSNGTVNTFKSDINALKNWLRERESQMESL